MRAGNLRHVVCVQTSTPSTLNSYGEQSSTSVWSEFATVRAAIEPLKGNERMTAMMIQSEATHNIRMRYLPGMTSKMRVKFGTRVFEILEPPRNTDERNYETTFLVQETP